MEKKISTKLDTKIILRVAANDKIKYKKKAKDLGISLSELILSLLEGLPPPDRKQYESLYLYISKLTTEMNYIGNNINQVTTVIHQTKNNGQLDMSDFNTFNKLFQEYNSKRDSLKEQINKIIFL